MARSPPTLRLRTRHPAPWLFGLLANLLGIFAGLAANGAVLSGHPVHAYWLAPVGVGLVVGGWLWATMWVRMGPEGLAWRTGGRSHRVRWEDVLTIVPHARGARHGVFVTGRRRPWALDFTFFSATQRPELRTALAAWLKTSRRRPPRVDRLYPSPATDAAMVVVLGVFGATLAMAYVWNDQAAVVALSVVTVLYVLFLWDMRRNTMARIVADRLHFATFWKRHSVSLRDIRRVAWGDEILLPLTGLEAEIAELLTKGRRPRMLEIACIGRPPVVLNTGLAASGTPTLFVASLVKAARAHGALLDPR